MRVTEREFGQREKGGELMYVEGVKEGMTGPFQQFTSRRGFVLGTAIERLQGGWVFRGKAFLEDSTMIQPPIFLSKIFIWGLTVAPHGDGFFLKESRIQELISWCRPDACCLNHPFFLQISCHNILDTQLSRNIFRTKSTYPNQNPNNFPLGAFELADPLHFILQQKQTYSNSTLIAP